MKTQLFQVFAALTMAGVVLAAQPAKISLGKPYHKKIPPSDGLPGGGGALLMVPFTVTNSTKGRISFMCDEYNTPRFLQNLSDPKNGQHRNEVPPTGYIGFRYSTKTLAPGETLSGEQYVISGNTGQHLRFMLDIKNESSDSHAPVRVKSDFITLP